MHGPYLFPTWKRLSKAIHSFNRDVLSACFMSDTVTLTCSAESNAGFALTELSYSVKKQQVHKKMHDENGG